MAFYQSQLENTPPTLTVPSSESQASGFPTEEANTDPEETWCYCKQGESGEMIMCESDKCKITWFHFECLKITTPPKRKWFCPDCRKEKATSTKKKKTAQK